MKKAIIPTIMSAKIQAKEGEWIEEKVRRVVENGEPIEDGAPIVYTERKDGVRPEYNIRTDRWEIAQEAMEAVREGKSKMIAMRIAERDGKPEKKSQPDGENSTGTELSQ